MQQREKNKMKNTLTFLTTLAIFNLIFSIKTYSQNSLPQTTRQIIEDNQERLEEITNQGERTVIIDDEQINDNLDVKNIIFGKNKLKSIMLDSQEVKGVEEALEAFQFNKPLSQEEIDNTQTIETQVKQIVEPAKEQSRIYLDAILYISKNNWIAWINGEKFITEDNNPKNPIYIKSISNNKANIVWTMGISKWRVLTGLQVVNEEIYYVDKITNQIILNFTLRTNQTYNLINNKVTEGKVRVVEQQSKQ